VLGEAPRAAKGEFKMAFKLVAVFRKAEGDNQAAQGDKTSDNSDSQVAFLKTLPGAERVVVGTVTGTPRGEAQFSRMVEVYFKDRATGQAALVSPEVRTKGQEMFKGLGKAKLFYVQEEE